MAETLIERAWTWLPATFPERQIYIRSHGRVQFFTFGSTLQATCAGLTLIFLGWVAFASVNVIFKDRIIAAKNHRYQEMQSGYENRVADLQGSYDELNGARHSNICCWLRPGGTSSSTTKDCNRSAKATSCD